MSANVRKIALELLRSYELEGRYVNLLLSTAKVSSLDKEEKAFLTTLLYTTVENKLKYDYLICKLSKRSMDSVDPFVRDVMRIGMCQIIDMRSIPDFAAVNETVKLARHNGERAFINALLRETVRVKDSLPYPDRAKNEIRYLSVRYSVPLATVKLFFSLVGEDTERLLLAFSQKSALSLTVNGRKASRDELISRFAELGAAPSRFSPNGIELEKSVSPTVLDGFERGEFFVQDEASQISTAVLASERGMKVIDMCACPGSKSFGAALTMENEGTLLAFDLSKSKLPLISSGASRLGIDIISSNVRDGRDFLPELEGSADRIICDVPCSGFGVVAKKPEIRYKDINSAAALPDIQYGILCNAARYLKKGGVMVYSTCTVLPEENEENVKRFLSSHPEFSPVPFNVGGLTAENGMITLLPHIHGTDGFFICKLIKQ